MTQTSAARFRDHHRLFKTGQMSRRTALEKLEYVRKRQGFSSGQNVLLKGRLHLPLVLRAEKQIRKSCLQRRDEIGGIIHDADVTIDLKRNRKVVIRIVS